MDSDPAEQARLITIDHLEKLIDAIEGVQKISENLSRAQKIVKARELKPLREAFEKAADEWEKKLKLGVSGQIDTLEQCKKVIGDWFNEMMEGSSNKPAVSSGGQGSNRKPRGHSSQK